MALPPVSLYGLAWRQDALDSLVSLAAPYVREGEWMPMWAFVDGSGQTFLEDPLPSREEAARRANKRANKEGWLPFVATLRKDQVRVYACSYCAADGRFITAKTGFVNAVARGLLSHYLEPVAVVSGPRLRQTELAD